MRCDDDVESVTGPTSRTRTCFFARSMICNYPWPCGSHPVSHCGHMLRSHIRSTFLLASNERLFSLSFIVAGDGSTRLSGPRMSHHSSHSVHEIKSMRRSSIIPERPLPLSEREVLSKGEMSFSHVLAWSSGETVEACPTMGVWFHEQTLDITVSATER